MFGLCGPVVCATSPGLVAADPWGRAVVVCTGGDGVLGDLIDSPSFDEILVAPELEGAIGGCPDVAMGIDDRLLVT